MTCYTEKPNNGQLLTREFSEVFSALLTTISMFLTGDSIILPL